MRKVIPAVLMGLYLVIGQIAVTACAAESDKIVVEKAPPLSRHEPPPNRTRRGWVWAEGYWTVSGRHFKWQKGRWLLERPGYKYQQAEWIKVPNGWQLRPGHWQPSPTAAPG